MQQRRFNDEWAVTRGNSWHNFHSRCRRRRVPIAHVHVHTHTGACMNLRKAKLHKPRPGTWKRAPLYKRAGSSSSSLVKDFSILSVGFLAFREVSFSWLRTESEHMFVSKRSNEDFIRRFTFLCSIIYLASHRNSSGRGSTNFRNSVSFDPSTADHGEKLDIY